MSRARRLPIGAELQPGGAHFRVWAPASRTAAVELVRADGSPARVVPLSAEAGGYFSGAVDDARAGDRYKFKLERGSFPDPASRFQPDGPHGPSQLVDLAQFRWTDAAWRGRPARELVVYELHLGTFTSAGTWTGAAERLPALAELGITMIEVMPVADFPGKFGWGYDGVNLFAPMRLYGGPDEVRAFVDRAHALGVAVILDVVYNHLGPDGNYLREFSPDYFHASRANEWGDALNFDEANCGPVREFFVSNARYWIEEFHFDGLRLDATQQIHDASAKHVIAEITEAVRAAAPGRETYVVAETETQDARLARPVARGGYGVDALWNDDFHHVAHVAATGRSEAYYSDYRGTAHEFLAAAKHGFLFQGQRYDWQRKRRGSYAFDLTPGQFVNCLENHDQVANSLRGLRLHQETSPAKYRALTAVLLLQPQIPMLFQGQEFAASAPFLYFADHRAGLREDVAKGRHTFITQFASLAEPQARPFFTDPADPATFALCKLDHGERERHAAAHRLHADLLRLRREEPLIQSAARFDGAVLTPEAFVLRFFSPTFDADRLLVVNLGRDLHFSPAPEPLLAPCAGRGWQIRWSSEDPSYGGSGTPPLETTANWRIPGHCAVWLTPAEKDDLPAAKLSEKE